MGFSNVIAEELSSGTGDVTVRDTGTNFYGYSIRENAGSPAAATVIVRNGTTNTDPIVAVIEIAADDDDDAWYGPQGIRCEDGLRVERSAGTTEGAVYVG